MQEYSVILSEGFARVEGSCGSTKQSGNLTGFFDSLRSLRMTLLFGDCYFPYFVINYGKNNHMEATMRILFDSKQLQFKEPFGTLLPGESCTLHIHVPSNIMPTAVEAVIQREDGALEKTVPMEASQVLGAYQVFSGSFTLDKPELYFYFFRITAASGTFRLFKQGDDTNMEAGTMWQVSCVPASHTVAPWAQGAVIYQLFPDRFHKSGSCDLTGKLEPYTMHLNWEEEVDWEPNHEGLVLNNDFFGGNFKGIIEKMDYIASMGVTILYLNPISKSFSSHRYDTGDYKTVDPMLGTEADFTALCDSAHKHGIKVILDGVYSHTGDNSLYFNRKGTFPSVGAYQSKESPYFGWYNFTQYPNHYTCWWDFDTLPTVNKLDPGFVKYIITDKDSVVAHWLKAGADGFRLDVADELPDEFLRLLKKRIRELKPDALLLGEVWEDASNKQAYGVRRRYFTDGTLDSVMNYPFRNAILDYVRDRDFGQGLKNTVMTIAENYPPQVFLANMNLLGTHDTPRILTALVDDFQGDRYQQAQRKLSRSQYITAQERLLMASFLQYMLPGSPSLYYGDEAGMEGHKDPFNRRTYPWGRENTDLLSHFQRLGQLRKHFEALRTGDIQFQEAQDQRLAFTRSKNGKRLRIYCNRNADPWAIPAGRILFGHNLHTAAPDWLALGEHGFCIVED